MTDASLTRPAPSPHGGTDAMNPVDLYWSPVLSPESARVTALRICASGGQDGRDPAGGQHLIYLAHSARESGILWRGFGNGRSILGADLRADRPNDGRHQLGAGSGLRFVL